ncbi:hypothetical protein [Capnocytophaga cynodegmi]|uniref:Uncharacterized protein n=1 Tax=Capnocytophaga cynodegmi TaxID=28189 RepID=A0A0B7HLJ2_9FLAO|nr:hypothetical protein [Capnocytophaga cynodegmi]CEN40621.1 hypothetical protein CCYN74_430049 [Capnocytophaga cynodegmi]
MENILQTTSNVIHIILGVILAIEKVNKFTFEINQPICEMQLAVIEQNNIALSKQIAKRKQNRQIIISLVYLLIAVLIVWFMYNQYKKLQVS